MKKRAKILAAVFLASVVALFCVTQNTVSAEEASNRPAVWLQISPTQERLTLNPGDSYDGKISVSNIGAEDFDFKVYASPFSVVGEGYSHNYEAESSYNQISRWITFEKTSFSLEINETIEVGYHIEVPEDVAGGSQHAVIFAESSESTTSEGIKAVSRVGMRLIASISGETRTESEITEYLLPQLYISFGAPDITATSKVKNTGNTDAEASYILDISTFFGGETVYSNSETQLVYPETELKRSMFWTDTPLLGLFKVFYSVTVGGETQESTRVVFVMPTWLLIILLILLTFVIIWIILKVKKRHQLRSKVRF